MATWWELTITGKPNDADLEHIAKLVKEGYTSGQLVETEPDISNDEFKCDNCGTIKDIEDSIKGKAGYYCSEECLEEKEGERCEHCGNTPESGACFHCKMD